MIELVGLVGFEDRHPGELSGGMQQRVNLARALVIDPEVILLDEPFAALDAQTRELMQTELLRVWDETKKTAVFITHQISEAVYLADRVVVMSARPGNVKAIVPVPIARPRPASARRDPQMFAIESEIAALIEGSHTETVVSV
jgi:NitT/TauT family transport system ATP-binding protein